MSVKHSISAIIQIYQTETNPTKKALMETYIKQLTKKLEGMKGARTSMTTFYLLNLLKLN